MTINYNLVREKVNNSNLVEQMSYGNTDYDLVLLDINVYKKHPELLPFIGKNFGKNEPKILLVGESHYIAEEQVENNKSVKDDFDKTNWYTNPNIVEESVFYKCYDYYTTRHIVYNYAVEIVKSGGYNIFTNPLKEYCSIKNKCKEYCSIKNKCRDNLKAEIHNFAFMNFFQRPAFNFGKTIDYSKDDKDYAIETLDKVINCLKPDAVMFLSTKAGDLYMGKNKNENSTPKFYKYSHPTCSWWWRETKSTGEFKTHEKFKNDLSNLLNHK